MTTVLGTHDFYFASQTCVEQWLLLKDHVTPRRDEDIGSSKEQCETTLV